jgi:replicative DNA helicase
MTAAAENAKRDGGMAPAVVLDYLQLIEGEAKQEQAEVIKRAVKAMKDYAIRYNTFVFVIIANNRESNKTGQASMDSGRDTSAIEYSADTMLQLAYTASLKRKGDGRLTPDQILSIEDEETRLRVKSDVTLRVVKKRNGEPGRSMRFHFDGASSRYTPFESRYDNFDIVHEKTPFEDQEE